MNMKQNDAHSARAGSTHKGVNYKRVTVGDSGLCCCTCVMYFARMCGYSFFVEQNISL